METERLLALGRPIVCFAYPNVYHHRVAGFTGCDRYFWLPAPSGMQYRESHLLPGDGSAVITTDSEHPFASYVDAFKKRLGYRAYFADAIPNFSEFGHVFARSAGGAAVGVELTVGAGRIVFIPPVAEPGASSDRHPLAKTIVDCLRRLLGREAEGPAPLWLKESPYPAWPSWRLNMRPPQVPSPRRKDSSPRRRQISRSSTSTAVCYGRRASTD